LFLAPFLLSGELILAFLESACLRSYASGAVKLCPMQGLGSKIGGAI
jgi:hypothetical protein